MQINGSAFQNGLTGFQTSQNNLAQASSKVAHASSTESSQANSSAVRDGLVEATTSKQEAQANAKVLETANKTLGSIIDITA